MHLVRDMYCSLLCKEHKALLKETGRAKGMLVGWKAQSYEDINPLTFICSLGIILIKIPAVALFGNWQVN